MNYNVTNTKGTYVENDISPEVESQTFGLIRNINTKLEHLARKLEPIRVSVPEGADKEVPTTQLINELKMIDARVAGLLDTIVL